MFTVYDNGIEIFRCASYEEAVKAAAAALSQWAPALSYLHFALANEEPYDYTGYGDRLVIKED